MVIPKFVAPPLSRASFEKPPSAPRTRVRQASKLDPLCAGGAAANDSYGRPIANLISRPDELRCLTGDELDLLRVLCSLADLHLLRSRVLLGEPCDDPSQ